MGVAYATREDVSRAADVRESAHASLQIDRLIQAASRHIEAICHRKFYPLTATRYFSWPDYERGSYARPWVLYLDADELISVTTLTAAGLVIASTDYLLEPINTGPPFTRIELARDSAAVFTGASTQQRAVTIAGVWGHSAQEAPAGTIVEALDASETGVDVDGAASAAIGVGSILRIDAERLIVTDRAMVSTGQTLQTPLTASNSNVTVAVTTGSAYAVGETILLDSERMLVVDIAGNNLTVKRAWDGTVIAAHTGPTIYAPRTLAVARGALGTTAATHLTAAPIVRHVVPELARATCVAIVSDALSAESAGYATSIGTVGNKRDATGAQLPAILDALYWAHGRKMRTRAI